MARPKSNWDEAVTELYSSGMSVEEVAEEMGYTIETTKKKLWALGIYDPPISKYDPIWEEWGRVTAALRKEEG